MPSEIKNNSAQQYAVKIGTKNKISHPKKKKKELALAAWYACLKNTIF